MFRSGSNRRAVLFSHFFGGVVERFDTVYICSNTVRSVLILGLFSFVIIDIGSNQLDYVKGRTSVREVY